MNPTAIALSVVAGLASAGAAAQKTTGYTSTPVQVTIDATSPVPVRNVNDAVQPVQPEGSCTVSNGFGVGCSLTLFYRVPAGKRLAIEYASMEFCILPGVAVGLAITTTVSG